MAAPLPRDALGRAQDAGRNTSPLQSGGGPLCMGQGAAHNEIVEHSIVPFLNGGGIRGSGAAGRELASLSSVYVTAPAAVPQNNKKGPPVSGVIHKTVKIFKRRDFRGHAFCHKRIAAKQRKGYSPLRGTQ